MGAKAILAETADQLRKALVEARQADRVTVIVVPVDPEKRMPGLGTWWDVPVAEVSSAEKTQETRRRYEEAAEKQRPVL
jgi:3D-(3,5/4)-trihydroxycyclohexane-1,2-dione acylhydrolase (decyclizing)